MDLRYYEPAIGTITVCHLTAAETRLGDPKVDWDALRARVEKLREAPP